MWKALKLGDVCKLRNGRAYKKPELLDDGKYKVLRVGNLFTNNKWYYSDLELDESKYCDNGDLLYAWSASFGPFMWNDGKSIYHYHIWRVDIDEALIDKKFLYYWFMHDKELIKTAHGTGTTMMHVSKSSMEERNLLVPSIPEQQRIVARLDKLFVEINKNKINIENQVKQLKKLFTKYLNTTFQNSKYKSIKIGDITGVKSGGTPSTTNKNYWNGTIPWYSSRELNDYRTKDSVKKITKLALKNSNAKIFPKNTLLIGIYDTAAMKMSILHQEGTFNQAIVGIPPNSKFETEYLFFVLNYLKDKILLERRGVRQMNLSLAKIKNINIPMPTQEEQKKIINTCNKFKEQTKDLEKFFVKKLYLLKSLRKSILTQEFDNKAA